MTPPGFSYDAPKPFRYSDAKSLDRGRERGMDSLELPGDLMRYDERTEPLVR